ncbi:MAG: hypothetical protein DRP09_10395 [Candidatus Thorarchaeota archaeon]|nr:MAG: hypothetical protein DRP09_10395 [Candidatus Thorarchaeota archaeon]
MTKKIAYIASQMKLAERLMEDVLNMLSKRKIESWDFTDDDIQAAWEKIDRIVAIDQHVSVGLSLAKATERVELAEVVISRREELERLGLPYDDLSNLRTLEEF